MNLSTVETQPDRDGWSQALGANSGPVRASSLRGGRSDEQLARAAGRGDAAAFEALYERHHRALLSFSRHMLGRAHDAEDVVQHTFLAADRAFRGGKVPKAVRAWLYTVARNRCVSLLRARREESGLPDAGVPSTENLAADVEQREDLRALLGDLRALPDDQRAALLLSELGDLTHAEVAKVIGVRPGKVKALVFQAREALLTSAHARAIPCHSIQEELANATGSALRRRHLKHHLAQCEGCRVFLSDVRAQRAALGVLLPVVPTVALKEGIFGGLAAGGAAASAGAGAGIGAGILANSTAAKLLTTLAVGGAAAGGGIAVTKDEPPRQERPARSAPAAPAAVVPARVDTPRGDNAAPGPGRAEPPGKARARARARTAPPDKARARGRAAAPGQTEDRGRDAAPGQTKERGRDAAPGQNKPDEPGHGRDSAPGQNKAPKVKAAPKLKVKTAPTPKVKAAPEPKVKAAPKAKPAPKPPKVTPAPAQPAPGASKEPSDAGTPEQVELPPGQARKG